MMISEIFCPVCSTAFTASDFEELSCFDLIKQHNVTKCPKCNSEGLKLQIKVPGLETVFKLPRDVESKEIFGKGIVPTEDSKDGTSIIIIPTYKESAVAKNLWYIIVQKKTGDNITSNIVRLAEAGNPWIAKVDNPADNPIIFSVIEKNLDEILEMPPISSISLKPAISSTANGKRKAAAQTPKKSKVSYVVACNNHLVKRPVYLTVYKGAIAVSQIYDAEVYESEEAAQGAITSAKEEFGSAYNHYDVLPIPTVIARAIIHQKKRN